MNLVERSYQEIFNKPCKYQSELKYSGSFKGFNANIRLSMNKITVSMSKQWKDISDEIKIGLIQSLLIKLFKKKVNTHNIDFYNNFLRNVHIAIPKNEPHEILKDSFDKVNNMFFDGLMERPNLHFNNSINRLGTYEYGTDTITISKYLLTDLESLNYVMYHEMLHKKHKFYTINNRSYHHTAAFKEKEAEFPNSKQIELKLQKIVNKSRFKRILGIDKAKLF